MSFIDFGDDSDDGFVSFDGESSPSAKKDLPADVAPSKAGGGRGSVNPPVATDKQPVRGRADADTRALSDYDRIDAGEYVQGQDANFYRMAGPERRKQLREGAGEQSQTRGPAAKDQPKPFKNRIEALDDAVNMVEEGADVAKVVEAFSSIGIKPQEIVAHGQKRGSEYFQKGGVLPSGEPSAPVRTIAKMTAIEPTTLEEYVVNPVMRGVGAARKASNVAAYEAGIIGAESAAKGIIAGQRTADNYQAGSDIVRQREAIAEADKQGALSGVASLFKNPAAAFTSVVESLASSALTMGATAGIGSLAGPVGTAAGAFAGSGATEYSSTILDKMQERGIPITAEGIVGALTDEKFMADARQSAKQRGLIVGTFDALSAGLAGRFIKPVLAAKATGAVAGRELAKAELGAGVKEFGMQAGFGSGGEAAAQLAESGKITSGSSVALEALAEGFGAPADIAPNLYNYAKNSPAPVEPITKAAAAPADVLAAPNDIDAIVSTAANAVDTINAGAVIETANAEANAIVEAVNGTTGNIQSGVAGDGVTGAPIAPTGMDAGVGTLGATGSTVDAGSAANTPVGGDESLGAENKTPVGVRQKSADGWEYTLNQNGTLTIHGTPKEVNAAFPGERTIAGKDGVVFGKTRTESMLARLTGAAPTDSEQASIQEELAQPQRESLLSRLSSRHADKSDQQLVDVFNASEGGVYSTSADAVNGRVPLKVWTPAANGGVIPPSVKFMQEIAKRTGARIVLIDGGKGSNVNGFYNDGVIYVDPNSRRAEIAVFGHEFGHNMRDADPQAYEELSTALMDAGLISEDAIEAKLKLLKGKNKTRDKAIEEAVMDLMGNRLNQKSFWTFLAKKDSNAFVKLYESVKAFFAKVSGKKGFDTDLRGSELQAAMDMIDDVARKFIGTNMAQMEGTKFVGKEVNEVTRAFKFSKEDDDAPDFSGVSDEDIKSKGLSPEAAFPAPKWTTVKDKTIGKFKVGGDVVEADYRERGSPTVSDVLFDKYAPTKGLPMATDMGGLNGMAKAAWIRRYGPSLELFRRKYDLHSAVTPEQSKRIADTWKKISNAKGAHEFNKPEFFSGATTQKKLQDIATTLFYGTNIEATVKDSKINDFDIVFKDTKTGATNKESSIEYLPFSQKIAVHAAGLNKDSGFGKALYQIANVFARETKSQVMPDDWILGANSYRRTEHQFAGFLRNGGEFMQPAASQRIYGWQKDDQNNLTRLALAGVRNALEFAPKLGQYGYDMENDKFYSKAAPKNEEAGLLAEQYIKMTLADPDTRAASVSRSTLARAAITLQAMDGEVALPDNVAKPILYSQERDTLVDVPKMSFKKLVGKKVFGIKADLTDAGVDFTGIDSSKIDPVELMGGPNYPQLKYNAETGVVWAIRGGAVMSKIIKAAKGADYMLVHAMNDRSHLTNSTVSSIYLKQVEAYVRDGRISAENIQALDTLIRSGSGKASFKDFVGLESPDLHDYIDKLSFERRGDLAKILEKKEAQSHGLPSIDKVRRGTLDPEYAGFRQGDAMLIIQLDKNPKVTLGENGTKVHPSYEYALKGKVVGKLEKPVNYEQIYDDYFAGKVQTFKNKEKGAWYGFDRVIPIQEITPEIASRVSEGKYDAIASARHASAALHMANENWLESGRTKANGGVSVQEFVDALAANDASSTLSVYTAKEVNDAIKKKTMRVFQLGIEGGDNGMKIFFGLKKGKPWYADFIDGVKSNEVELVSVTNNEKGVTGIGIPAILTKAIKEGATVLDAYAVKSKKFPKGFLPEMYAQFGFKEIGRVTFDPDQILEQGNMSDEEYAKQKALKLADMKDVWAKGGWKESDGYPDVVVMRWKGNDDDRARAIERYVREGATSVPSEAPEYVSQTTDQVDQQRDTQGGDGGWGRGTDGGQTGRNQGASNAAPVVTRAYRAITELARLSDSEIKNLGLSQVEVQRLRDTLGKPVAFSLEADQDVKRGYIKRSVDELVQAAQSQSNWRDWYQRHEQVLADVFGSDAPLFQKLLSATSQATGVKGNVTLALKAFKQIKSGDEFTGFLPAVIKNLERIRNDEELRGAKISQYGEANEGSKEAIAVDRHIAMLMFDVKTPNKWQIAAAKQRIRDIANILDWEPRQVQAALWAFNQVRLGTDPTKVQSYDAIITARADEIQRLRAEVGGGATGSTGASRADAGEDGVQGRDAEGDDGAVQGVESPTFSFSIEPPEQAKKLESGEKVTLYRAMSMIDGKLYPPMSAKMTDAKGNLSLRNPEPIGVWMRSEERPDMVPTSGANAGMFPLKKPGGGTTWALYAPYFHASPIPLNDQFTAAWKNDGVERPQLVTVEVEVPASEMTSGYQAEGSVKKVGPNKWNSGVVASKIPGGREVVLSRYIKIKRVVPDAEVAQKIAAMVNPNRLSIPENTVTPQLRAELEKQGVRIAPQGTRGDDIRYSQEVWRSDLKDSIDAAQYKALPAKGWSDYIKGLINKGAVKASEVEWTGVNEWLDMQQGKVTKESLQQFIDGNGVQVEETVLGAPGKVFDVYRRKYGKRGAHQMSFATEQDAEDWVEENYTGEDWDEGYIIEEAVDEDDTSGTRYSDYTLPGGEKYREVLLTLPNEKPTVTRYAAIKGITEAQAIADRTGFIEWRTEELSKQKQQTYQSSHWDAPNVLAHIRLNDRTDSDGKRVLFVEELQSDWGQDYKKNGGKPSALNKSANGDWIYKNPDGVEVNLGPDIDERSFRAGIGERMGNIPTAPFVTKTEGWLNLALKRVIKMAVDEGYDKVAFVNGEQSADRYDLSKQVDSIHITKLKKGGFEFTARQGGRELVSREVVPDAQALAAAIGKDLAEKAETQELDTGKTYSGIDLKVGGEGMKDFYDNIVPNAVSKLVKKLGGGKMEMVDFTEKLDPRKELARRLIGEVRTEAGKSNENRPTTQPGFTITDKMRAEAAGGLPMFSLEIVGQTDRVYTPRQLRGMDAMGARRRVPTLKERTQALMQDAGKKLAQGIADQFMPVAEFDKKAYGLMRLSKGASGAFEVLLQGGKLKLTDGVYDFDAERRGGVVEKLLLPLQGEHHDFLRWVAAHRAERLLAEDRENLFTLQTIEDLKSLEDGTTKFDYTIQHGPMAGTVTRNRATIYKDSLKTFSDFNKNVMDMAEQSGLIDPEARAFWEHEFYVPFYRISEEDGFNGASIKKGVVRQRAFKELKGGTDMLNADLLDNTLMNWAHLLDASAKNRAAVAALEAAVDMGIAIEAPKADVQDMAKSIRRKAGVVWAMDAGVQRFFLVDDPYVLEALNGLEYAGLKGGIWDVLTAPKRWLTIGVTASPGFKFRNLVRDSVQAISISGLSYNLPKNIYQGFKLSDPKGDQHFRLLAGGGTIHFGTMYEGSEAKRIQALVESGVKDFTILNDPLKLKNFWRKYIEPGVTAYNELGNRGEEINRASLYNQLIKQGVSHAEASLQARDLMDFSMSGSFTTIRFLTQILPFFNARVQGLYKLGRGAKEDPRKFMAVAGMVTMASLALLAMYHDDDDWKQREEWDRNNFWWFKFGGTAFRIPKPFEVGVIGTLAERGMEWMTDKEMTNKRFAGQVYALLRDNLAMPLMPWEWQAVKPIAEIYFNKSSFTGRPIENSAMEKLDPQYRYNGNTTMMSRYASQGMSSVMGTSAPSPLQIDHFFEGYFSWLGSFVAILPDLALRAASNEPSKPTPDYLKEFTFGTIADKDSGRSRYVSQMYEQARELEYAYNSHRDLLKKGKTEEAKQYRKDNAEKLKLYGRVEGVKKNVGALNERIRMIERSNKTGDEKRDAIQKLREQQDRMARQLVPR